MMITSVTLIGDSEKQYTVTATLEGVKCTCPDHRFRNRECKHIKFLREKLAVAASASTSLVPA